MMIRLAANELITALRRALQHLYDPAELRRSPLFELLGIPAPADRVAGLRSLLQAAIQSLKPPLKAASDSAAQRTYDILIYRFIEQSSQKEVASDLALSLRQLQRLETAALQALAETLACRYNLELTWDEPALAPEPPAPAQDQVAQELAWLKKSYQVEEIHLRDLITPVLATLAPLLQAAVYPAAGSESIRLDLDLPDFLPPVRGQATSLQQALLNLLSLVAQGRPRALSLSAKAAAGRVRLEIWSDPPPTSVLHPDDETFSLARQLLNLSGAELNIPSSPETVVQVDFLARGDLHQAHPLILVVDDNQDTLLLLERHLTGSDYRYHGTPDPRQIIPLLEQLRPTVIVLDVMLPGCDGWSLLSQIKQHPAGAETRVIISTILPQERLALTLGADAFLRKPFTREDLLQTLDKF